MAAIHPGHHVALIITLGGLVLAPHQIVRLVALEIEAFAGSELDIARVAGERLVTIEEEIVGSVGLHVRSPAA